MSAVSPNGDVPESPRTATSAADVIAEAHADHDFYRLIGNPVKPTGWLCRCGVETDSPEARLLHRAESVEAALKAAGYVVATREEIRAWPVEKVAELIGGHVLPCPQNPDCAHHQQVSRIYHREVQS